MKIKRFNENEKWEIDLSTWEDMKENIISKIKDLLVSYDEFTKYVSVNNWRTTGTHHLHLKQMIEDIEGFERIENYDKLPLWVKKELDK